MSTITLTNDQQAAMDGIHGFLLDPTQSVFLLSGYSGTGKTTLIKTLLAELPGYMKMGRLIRPDLPDYQVVLTATTNKAAENFQLITNQEVMTIHKFLGLRVMTTDYVKGISTLIPNSLVPKEQVILFVDEVSFMDAQLMTYLFQLTRNSKVILIGDPAQLTPIKSVGAPVFDANFTGAHLSQVVRQAEGNPIVSLSTKFREAVNSGTFFKFTPDGTHVQHLPRAAFDTAILEEFSRPDWKHQDSKVLGWTNKCVIAYNKAINAHAKGNPEFQVGDYAVCNAYVAQGRNKLKTDQLVQITKIAPKYIQHGVTGNDITLDHSITMFFPKSLAEKKALIKKSKAQKREAILEHIATHWVDLRYAYASTINKAQGSTFDRVYIDLDDVSQCNIGDQIARMLYVGVSRARHQVFLTGDIG